MDENPNHQDAVPAGGALRGLLRSTAVVGGMTLLSRVLGFVRDVVLARFFGAGVAPDAFFVAFKIPNFFRRLFGEGAFAQAFVPVLGEYRSQRAARDVQALVDRVAGTLGGVVLLVTAVGILAAPVFIVVFAGGFVTRGGQFAMAVELLRVTFPYLAFISLTAFAGGVLNTYGRFGVPAFTPVLLNICLIVAAVWLAPLFPEGRQTMALAVGVFVAGMVQLGFQLPFLARVGLLPRPRWGWRDPGVRRILRLMLPAAFGSSVAQINLLLDTLIASFLAAGSISWLYYSDRLVEFPLGVLGIALATVILPSLSARHAERSPEGFRRTLDWALRWVLVIGLPATVGLVVLAGPILVTLFQYGAFTARDAAMAALSLMAYGVGLLGFILVKVLAPGFYARQDTRTPVRAGVIAMVSNALLNLGLVIPLARAGYEAPHAGLALATAVATYINAGILLRNLRAQRVYAAEPGWAALAAKVVAACLLLGLALWYNAPALAEWVSWGLWRRIAHLVALIVGGMGLYFGLLWLLRVRLPLRETG